MISNTRNALFDVAKGLMMLWVLWAHLARYDIVVQEVPQWFRNAIIGFNMPIFFIISGYFALSTFQQGSWGKIAFRSLSFIWPQVVFSAICATFVLITTGGGVQSTFNCVMGFWFLRCLVVIYIIAAIVYRLCKSDQQRFLVFAVVYFGMLFMPSRFFDWRWNQVIHMFPYFVFGLMFLRRWELWEKIPVSIGCGLFFVLFVTLEGDCWKNGMCYWTMTASWRNVFFHLKDFVCFFVRPILGVAGSIAFLGLCDYSIKKLPRLSWLGQFGQTTQGVYVIHESVLMVVGWQLHISFLPLPSWTRWFVAIVYFVFCHYMIVAIKHFRITNKIFFLK